MMVVRWVLFERSGLRATNPNFSFPAVRKTSVWLCASPHSWNVNGRKNGWIFFEKCGGEEECVSGSWGVYKRVCLHTTHRDSAARQILPGHLRLWSAREVPRPPLSQDLHFLSGPGWVSNLLIAAVTTEWRACESGNQLPRRIFPPSSLLHVSDTMDPLCLCICRHGAPPAPGFQWTGGWSD